jgi:hypothetical protein
MQNTLSSVGESSGDEKRYVNISKEATVYILPSFVLFSATSLLHHSYPPNVYYNL